jgi:hypothetical protein
MTVEFRRSSEFSLAELASVFTAAAVFSEDDDRISLLQAAGDAAGLEALAAALRSRGKVSALNFPAGEPVATALRERGATVRLRQHEMVLRF